MTSEQVIGRYALYDTIATGGMATVYYGRLLGPVGFSRAVAIKQLHPQYSRDPDFVSMFVDEARLTARIRHPNAVPVLDVVKHGRELYIVMEYVLGVSLSELLKRVRRQGEPIEARVAASIMAGCLHGLHAAHETRDDRGRSLDIVHRDVSPSNVLVGKDGMARVLDFGIAKAVGRAQVTRHGEIKGKVGYMAPEQLRGGHVTHLADLYAAGVTLWEAITGLRAYTGNAQAIMDLRLAGQRPAPPSDHDAALRPFDDIALRALADNPEERWPSAQEMARALEQIPGVATHSEVADWAARVAGDLLQSRARVLAELEAGKSATEVRAAIKADLSLEDPSISVDTWSGSSVDLLSLYEEAPISQATTRDAPTDRRDDVPTTVESKRASSNADSAVSAAIELQRRADPRSAAVSGASAQAIEPEVGVAPSPEPSASHEPDAFEMALARASTAPPVSTPPPRRDATRASTVVVAGALAFFALGGAAALMFWTRDDATKDSGAPDALAASSTDAVGAASVGHTGDGEPARDPVYEPAGDPVYEPDAVAHSAPSTATASSANSAAAPPRVRSPAASPPHVKPSGKPAAKKDPFDALGGRH